MNAIYEESKTRQPSQKEHILKVLKAADEAGVLNTDLNDIMLRYGQIIYELRCEGYQIQTKNISNGIVKYTLLSDKPVKANKKEKGIDIVRRELDDLDGNFYLFELEDILERNMLQIIHKPNGLNKATSI